MAVNHRCGGPKQPPPLPFAKLRVLCVLCGDHLCELSVLPPSVSQPASGIIIRNARQSVTPAPTWWARTSRATTWPDPDGRGSADQQPDAESRSATAG